MYKDNDDPFEERAKTEKQSAFSELMRQHGIKTPMYYSANGNYCNEFSYNELTCGATVDSPNKRERANCRLGLGRSPKK